MKHRLTLLVYAALPTLTLAQAPAPVANPEVKLTDAQVKSVMTQLDELEKQIQQMRGSNISAVLQKLRDAMASDAAALRLYLECDALVNSTRKEETKTEARKREDQMQKAMEKKAGNAADDQGDLGTAIRLQIKYLVLTLEAHEAKDEELKKMVPKLRDFITEVLAAAPKLKGRAYGMLNQALGGGGGGGGRRGGGGNPIVEAFQLDRYLNVEKWSNRPLDFGGMYTQTILPLAELESNTLLAGLWDARITAEGTLRKEVMFAPEYELWLQQELPELRWERATYLYGKGPDPVKSMAEMLALIKEFPGHPSSPEWLKELRMLVEKAAPGETTGAPKPAGS